MMSKRLRAISLLLASVLTISQLAACGGDGARSEGDAAIDPSSSAQSETKKPAYRELTVYTALPESEIPVYFNAFEKDTGIKVNYVRLSAGEMLARIKAEAAHPNAAVMYGGSSDTYIAATEDDLLEPYQSPELSNVPDKYKDAKGIWNPCYVGAIAFACNKDWFQKNNLEYPKTWDDLTKPEFKGQISMAHPSTSGTSYTILATIVQMLGEDGAWEYFHKLNNNVRQYTKAGAAPPMEVGLGEAAVAITFSHDGLKPADEGYPVELSFPEDGTGYEVGGIAIIKNCPEKELENAKTFVDWVISKRGQECFIDAKSNRLPINATAKAADGLIGLEDMKVIQYDAVWAGQNRTRLIEEFKERIDSAQTLKES